MNYKALMTDVDGTLIPYDYAAVPSKVVVEAVKKAQQRVTVCLVTGRSLPFAKPILERLNLTEGYIVVDNGAEVIDLATGEFLYDQPLTRQDAEEIIELLEKENIPYYFRYNDQQQRFKEEIYTKGMPFSAGYMFFTDELFPAEKVDSIMHKLSHISDITMHRTRHLQPDKFGINISHVNATKLHGIQVVREKLGLKTEELIGVGDSYNDFPLLMACGLKVAMGNAIPDLKAIADYIAPPVTEDGLVDVIEKFVLKKD